MPGPNGLLARLRRDALTDFVPVVVLFQPGVPVDPIALREAGAVDSLRKPLPITTSSPRPRKRHVTRRARPRCPCEGAA
ncbi:MAG: hypothetical protein IPN77_33705 [Sandaracinaceae bacterium]|nr:hypothetical protein [Sandaracinaceae bacterium]